MIKIENVSFKYKKRQVLNSINLEIDSGVYGLLGPNGAGKTTLIRCITEILHPYKGTIIAPNSIGYCPQKFGFFKQLTVYETLEYFAALKEIPKKLHQKTIMECIEKVNLTEQREKKMGSLSGGMIRRVGIAQALLGDPKLIIFDEPTAGLDPEERLRFRNILSHIQKDSTVLVSTHIVEDVVTSCDHILVLNNGSVVSNSTPEELRNLASGKVFHVPSKLTAEIQSPYLIVNEDISNGVLRVLSNKNQPGEFASPTVEDGYLLVIHTEI